jgi:hypothetical protein
MVSFRRWFMLGRGFSMLAMSGQRNQQSNGYTGSHERRAAIADKWQGHALGRD